MGIIIWILGFEALIVLHIWAIKLYARCYDALPADKQKAAMRRAMLYGARE